MPFVALAVELESVHRIKSVFAESVSSKNPTALAGAVIVDATDIDACEKLPLVLTGELVLMFETVTVPDTG